MKLKDVVKTKAQIEEMGHSIENNIIEKVTVNIIGRFENCPCFEIQCHNVFPMLDYNTRQNLGYIMAAFVELFGVDEENGIRIEELFNIPCRLVFEGSGGLGSRCIGFGHFMKDKFVLTADFATIDA